MQQTASLAVILLISTLFAPTIAVGQRFLFSFHKPDLQAAEVEIQASRLNSSDVEERLDAVIRLGSIKTPAAVAALRSALNDVSEVVRRAAIEGMDGADDPQLLSIFSERLSNDKSIIVKKAASYALGNLQTQAATPALVAALGNKNAEVRSAAVVALGQYRDSSAIAALTNALKDKADFVRAHAAYALGINERNSAQAVSRLVRLLTSDKSSEVRRQAARALGRIGDRSALPELERARFDPDPYLSRAATEAIEMIESAH